MNCRRYLEEIFIFIISLLIGLFLSFMYYSEESIDRHNVWLRDIFEFFCIYFFVITTIALVGIFKGRREFMLPFITFCVVGAVFSGCSNIYNSFAGEALDFFRLLQGVLILSMACMLVTAFHNMYKNSRNMRLNQQLTSLEDIEMASIETDSIVFIPPNQNPRRHADAERSGDGTYDSTTVPSEDNRCSYEEITYRSGREH